MLYVRERKKSRQIPALTHSISFDSFFTITNCLSCFYFKKSPSNHSSSLACFSCFSFLSPPTTGSSQIIPVLWTFYQIWKSLYFHQLSGWPKNRRFPHSLFSWMKGFHSHPVLNPASYVAPCYSALHFCCRNTDALVFIHVYALIILISRISICIHKSACLWFLAPGGWLLLYLFKNLCD